MLHACSFLLWLALIRMHTVMVCKEGGVPQKLDDCHKAGNTEKCIAKWEGTNLLDAGAMDRDSCEALCADTEDCNAFSWKRDGTGCHLKKDFGSETLVWKTNGGAQHYDFCYIKSGWWTYSF